MIGSLAAPRSASDPPPIPGGRSVPVEHPGHTLVWVRTGRARVLLKHGSEFHIADGQGIWIPAGSSGSCVVDTEPDTVVLPLWLHAHLDGGGVSEPTRFEVSPDWQDWLIQHYVLQVTPLVGRGYSQEAILDVLRRSDLPPPGSNANPGPRLRPLTMPHTAGARAVAKQLLHNPALDLSVDEWATRVLSSPRTLRRHFIADTGLTFEQWRLRCRLTAAVEFLAAGYDADQVAARTGFASRGGFRRAFQRQFGSTPHEFAKDLSVRATAGALTGRVAEGLRVNDLVSTVRGERVAAPAPDDQLPPAQTHLHANDMHVLIWTYRGSGYLDVDGQRYERPRGSATWIPANVEHVTGLRQGSISLPLGDVTTADLQLVEPIQTQFSPAWDNYLMYCSVSARSLLIPDLYDKSCILDLFAEQVAAQRAKALPMPTDLRARAAAMDYLRRVGVSGGSSAFDVPAEVHRAFREETGMTFARWRYAARMRVARDLLAGGAKPSAVARRVGYGHLPNFSAAFTRFHGLTPREYQERETDQA